MNRYTLDYSHGLQSVMIIDTLTNQAIFCGSEETAKQFLAVYEANTQNPFNGQMSF